MSRLNVIEQAYDRPLEPPAMAMRAPDMPPPAPAAPESVKLRRTGGRAIRFHGSLLCTAMSYQAGLPFWYEISIYRKTTGAFVVAVKMFTRSEDQRDLFRVYAAQEFEELVELLEGYDPTADIDAIELESTADDMSPSLLALKGLGIRLRIEEARRQFGDLVGEILYELDVG